MNTIIYLIRHTRTTGNDEKRLTGRNDYEVTHDGQIFIDKLTNKLKDIKFDKAYSSSSKRTFKTIEPLAKLNNIEIEETDELCEMNFGIYDGWKWEDVNKINPKIDEDHQKTNEIMGIPGQESTETVADRMYDYIRAVSIENKGKVILMASHGVAIEAFIRKIQNKPFLEDIEAYSQKNTAINILEYDVDRDCFEVKLINDISHLNEKEFNER